LFQEDASPRKSGPIFVVDLCRSTFSIVGKYIELDSRGLAGLHRYGLTIDLDFFPIAIGGGEMFAEDGAVKVDSVPSLPELEEALWGILTSIFHGMTEDGTGMAPQTVSRCPDHRNIRFVGT
jgi:hypothetical protein